MAPLHLPAEVREMIIEELHELMRQAGLESAAG